MKHFILFCASLCLSVFAYTQTVKLNSDSSIKVKVNLSKDNLSIVYNNQDIPAASIRVLDSLIKKEPDPKKLTIEFESMNGEPEKIRTIDSVLKQYPCHITKHTIKFNTH